MLTMCNLHRKMYWGSLSTILTIFGNTTSKTFSVPYTLIAGERHEIEKQ